MRAGVGRVYSFISPGYSVSGTWRTDGRCKDKTDFGLYGVRPYGSGAGEGEPQGIEI